MESHERRPEATRDIVPGTPAPLSEASSFLSRLIPLAGTEALLPPSLPGRGGVSSDAVAEAVSQIAGQPAASIVSQAAAILDEEMARGVLAARGAKQDGPGTQPEGGNPLLRQLHELVDDIAAVLPNMQSAPRNAPGRLSNLGRDLQPRLEPSTAIRPGEPLRIGMILRNQEENPVQLVPTCTDLLSGSGGRIRAELLEFTPREVRLEAGEQVEVELAMTVPIEAPCGSYSGLLVVRGVEYLSALIAIDVR